MTAPTMTARRTDANPYMDPDSAKRVDHWRCMLHYQGRRMSLVYSMGSAYAGRKPTVGEVLSCLADDGAGLDGCRGFDDWCAEYGFDTDSRRAERTYRAVQRQNSQLRHLLGADYDAILAAHREG